MASGKSTGQRNATLDLWLGGVVPSVEANLWLALFTTPPNKNGGGVEVSTIGTNYGRILVVNDLAHWPLAVNGSKSNADPIQFAAASAAWGTILGCALVTTASGAYTQRYWGLLSRPIIIGLGDQRRFPAGALVVTES